ncbi:energy-coupling factor transporter transmembrane component T [Staphylococcus auricularis]|uniref:Energy-coupling factor transporter transmembrane protein EcfT n=1 Tax=Staphylococcus auricularis TaxID=29379 RepID=A0ABX5IFE3_9STAP|nr:energy-coupling factor transporter transmembrane component T [Staphylococcus auricularis]PTH18876.1 energy-coupling factor transporter transmembrane protein EcfT [Staphylococcus auricularis]
MYEVTIHQHHPFNLDPRVKIALMLVISLIALTGAVSGPGVFVRLILLCIPVILCVLIGQVKIGLLFGLLIGIAWYGEAFTYLPQHQILTLLIFIPSGIVTRFVPPLLMGYYILKSTQVEVLIRGLETLKIPNQVMIPIAVMFRFFPTIREEAAHIKDAMKMRGITVAHAWHHPIVYLEYRVVPLLNSVIKIGNELTIASMTRGLNLKHPRTSLIRIRFTLIDICFLVLTLVLFILYYLI